MEVVKIHMKKTLLVLMFVLAVAGFMMAQTWSSQTDVLGAHQNQGRGCAGCHAPHSGSFGSGHSGGADAGSYALWGQDASPLYGKSVAFGDNGRFVEVLPSTITGGSQEVGGILLCLSCHDGNLTPSNMMQNWSYEQQIGLLTNTTYGSGKIPTLLGNDLSGAGNYSNDHPVGLNATISTTTNGLVWANNAFTVSGGTPYAQFVANYGWPALAPGTWSNPYGVNGSGKPYVLCTTCHNQHVMTVYTSSAKSQIQNDGGGKYYATFFFINGPYNPNLQGKIAYNQAASTTQFCRQCHFGEANEANNTNNITTVFQ
jgi:nitrate/TMAO reductase-like tetraheme cytochrome c subunit